MISHRSHASLFHCATGALLCTVSASAPAITFGDLDNNKHPYVGSMVISIPDEGVFQWCSGTLIDTNVFLTASHCTAPIPYYLDKYPGSSFLVTFDETIDSTGTTGTFYTGTPHTNPLFGGGGNDDPHDVAVIVLDDSPGITPAQLPAA